jgi:hypothetical protein
MMASRSARPCSLSIALGRTHTRPPGIFGANSRTAARATAFSAGGTESSRSSSSASAGRPTALSRNFSRLAGT